MFFFSFTEMPSLSSNWHIVASVRIAAPCKALSPCILMSLEFVFSLRHARFIHYCNTCQDIYWLTDYVVTLKTSPCLFSHRSALLFSSRVNEIRYESVNFSKFGFMLEVSKTEGKGTAKEGRKGARESLGLRSKRVRGGSKERSVWSLSSSVSSRSFSFLNINIVSPCRWRLTRGLRAFRERVCCVFFTILKGASFCLQCDRVLRPPSLPVVLSVWLAHTSWKKSFLISLV